MTSHSDNMKAYVHCMLIPMTQHYLLLPNTTIAEVIPMPGLHAPTDSEQTFILGQYHWRDHTLPVIDIAPFIADNTEHNERSQSAAKLCIINGISGEIRHYATPCKGVPQLITVNESALSPVSDAVASEWVHSQLKIGNKTAFIPNLDAIEKRLKNHF